MRIARPWFAAKGTKIVRMPDNTVEMAIGEKIGNGLFKICNFNLFCLKKSSCSKIEWKSSNNPLIWDHRNIT